MNNPSLSLEEQILVAPVLESIPVRRKLLFCLIVLSLVLYGATGGWGPLFNETDGQYAGAAREMLATGDWLAPSNNGVPRLVKPPLLYWFTAGSFALFGVNEFAARLPMALSVTALVLLTFLIGERVGGTWRGFTAGLLLLTSCGTFVFGRMLMPEPLFAAFVAAAFFCILRGYEDAITRSRWFLAAWAFAGFATMSKGLQGLLYPLAAVAVLMCFRHAARLRLRTLFHWRGPLLFACLTLPWLAYVEMRFPGFLADLWITEHVGHLRGEKWPATFENVPPGQFLLLHLAWWFPWSLLVGIPALWCLRNMRRPSAWRVRHMDVGSALLLSWAGVVVIPLLFLGQRQDYYAFCMWPAAAIGASMAWGACSDRARLWGPALLVCIGVAGLLAVLFLNAPMAEETASATVERATAMQTVGMLPAEFWKNMRPLGGLTAAALILFGTIAFIGGLQNHFRFVLLAVAAGMVCVGFSIMEGVARVAPWFSLSQTARHLNFVASPGARVGYDAPMRVGSSLLFYLDHPLVLVAQDPLEEFAIRAGHVSPERFRSEQEFVREWRDGRALFLITESAHSRRWRQQLPGAVEIFHEGSQVLLGRP